MPGRRVGVEGGQLCIGGWRAGVVTAPQLLRRDTAWSGAGVAFACRVTPTLVS